MAAAAAPALAEVVTDGTAGEALRLDGPEFAIGADLGTRAGSNLFHSFERFDLDSGERATFSGPDAIYNLISRVTGGERSDIDGTLRSTIPGADLYFINPAGVVFGPNAHLDVQGAFHVSSADEVRFVDGARFSARNLSGSAFTIARPEAFGFLSGKPAPIVVDRSHLEVPTGEAFSIIAGDITVTDRNEDAADFGEPNLLAPDGRLALLGFDGAGEALTGAGRFEGAAAGAVTITGQAMLSTSGTEGAGAMQIRGGAITIDQGSFVAARTLGPMASGGLLIAGETVTIDNAELNAATRGTGDAGPIRVTASRSIDIRDAGLLITNSLGGGDAGDIILEFTRITLHGASVQAASNAAGDSGNISISGGELTIDRGTQLLTTAQGSGAGGDLLFDVDGEVAIDGNTLISASTTGTGPAGDIDLRVGSLLFTDGAQMATTTNGADAAGDISVFAAGDVEGADLPDGLRQFRTGLFTSTRGAGDAGAITICSNRLTVRDFAALLSEATGDGRAGDIAVDVGVLRLLDGGFVTPGTTGNGDGGSIAVTATRSVMIRGGVEGVQLSSLQADSQVFGSTTAPADLGDAGSITVATPLLVLDDDGQIVSRTEGGGRGGDVSLYAHDVFILDSAAVSTVARGTGDAGSIRIVAGGTVSIAGRNELAPSGLFLSSSLPSPEAGRVGALRLEAGRLEVRDGGLI